jgi:hypothetical protein
MTATDHARLMEARARVAAVLERMILENVAADYRRRRDPSDNLRQLLELQALKRRLGIQPGTSD